MIVTTYTSRTTDREEYKGKKRESFGHFVSAAKDKRKSVGVGQPVRRTLYKPCVYFEL